MLKINSNKIEKNAVILAAGFGSRLVPLTFEKPKGLLKINENQSMIERQIIFLKEKNITDITLVVGFKKEFFYELKEKYKLNIIENKEYNNTNSLYSLFLAKDKLKNTYILTSDTWIKNNYFNSDNEFSYLSIVKNISDNSNIFEWKIEWDVENNINKIKPCYLKKNDFFITGASYFNEKTSKLFIEEATKILSDQENKEKAYWEETLFALIKKDFIKINNQDQNIYEIDNLQDIYQIDKQGEILKKNICLKEICSIFNVKIKDIKNIQTIKKGLTNNSFSFEINDTKYVYRSPGIGTENIINRQREYKVYQLIKNFPNAEKLFFYNQKTASKISYFENDHKNVDQYNENEVFSSFKMIRKFHEHNYLLGNNFDIEEEINKYKKQINKSKYKLDLEKELSEKVYKIIRYVNNLKIKKVLCHIDFIPDNLLINDKYEVKLIDYEYAGDADPMIDIAAFATSAFYNKEWLDKTINIYFDNNAHKQEKIRVYAYMALLGYLWWIWTYAFIDKGNNISYDYLNHMLNNAKYYSNLLEEKYDIFKK